MMRVALLIGLLASSAAAQGLNLPISGAPIQVDESPAGSVRLPTVVWTPDTPVRVREGALRRSVYQFPNSTRTTLQLIDPIRRGLEDLGYSTVFGCADAACGGFDFRFSLDLLPEPAMYVDLGNYRYLLMEKEGATPHTVSLVASASSTVGFLHITEVSASIEASLPFEVTGPAIEAPLTPSSDNLVANLVNSGRAVLSDLQFETGAAALGEGPFATLSTLSAWLRENPTARVVLVGHTDAVGSLEANTNLSRRRAASVVTRMVEAFGVDSTQLQSAGAGFLAPLSSNLTTDGRSANRRVEVILLSID